MVCGMVRWMRGRRGDGCRSSLGRLKRFVRLAFCSSCPPLVRVWCTVHGLLSAAYVCSGGGGRGHVFRVSGRAGGNVVGMKICGAQTVFGMCPIFARVIVMPGCSF